MAEQVIAGRYRLDERLGEGGMSEVWAATDLDLDRKVAIKLLAPHADPVRFEREARAVAALAHPNVCALYGYGETGDRPFMVLEYLPGGSLEDGLAPGLPLPDGETAQVAHDLASGLAHAHRRGVVHRDLKPSNVLFDTGGRAKIADFGIARLGAESGLTAVGTVLGTAAYISPEQAAGEAATPASDVYSFGVILYRMLAGRLPFESEDALAAAAQHRDAPPPPITTFRPDAPPRLESVAMAALSKSPADRPQDGVALLTELGEPAPAGSATTATQILRPARGRGRATLAVAAALALGAAGAALAIVLTMHGAPSPLLPSLSTTFPKATRVLTRVSVPLPATLPHATTRPTTTTAAATATAAATTVPATTVPATTTTPTVTPPTSTAATTTAPPTTTAATTSAPSTTSATPTTPTDTGTTATATVPPG